MSSKKGNENQFSVIMVLSTYMEDVTHLILYDVNIDIIYSVFLSHIKAKSLFCAQVCLNIVPTWQPE
jgi:hypothetical protein